MKRFASSLRLCLLAGVLALASCQPVHQEAPAPAPQEFTVLTGAGQDVVAINAYFPDSIHVRVGDTITWKINSDEPHSVVFLSGQAMPPEPIPVPGGGPTDIMLNPQLFFSSRAPDAPVETYSGAEFRASGFLSTGKVVPPNESYSLTFDTPGTYHYICHIHPNTMKGEVVVEEAAATDIVAQEEIDTAAQTKIASFLEMAETTRAASTDSSQVRSEPGPNGTTIWLVPAGMTGSDPAIEIYDFFPKDLTVKKGDTVIWTSVFFHQVIFAPGQPAPEFAIPVPQEQGPPLITINPQAAFPAKPSGDFDGTGFYSSGLIGTLGGPLPGGTTFAMTFGEPGSYEYVCATHRPLGMKGSVTVVE